MPSTGLSEEAPIRLFAEVTRRILSHRGELKRQLSTIAYWKIEEVALFHGVVCCSGEAEALQNTFCKTTFNRLGRKWELIALSLFFLSKKRQMRAVSCGVPMYTVCECEDIPVLQPGREEPFSGETQSADVTGEQQLPRR